MTQGGSEFRRTVDARATGLALRGGRLEFDRLPMLMGIINVTPDSFSDGGQFLDQGRALEHALQLAESGADLLDVGGESTRPYAAPVLEAEERGRVVPLIARLAAATSVPISIDTSKPSVAAAALDAGAQLINDVSGLADPRMVDVARRYQAAVCVMHMQGTPQTMQDKPTYADVVREIHEYLGRRRAELVEAGVPAERICLDPGVGFGKTHQHNLTLLSDAWRFHDLGAPLLIGHSRKGFIAHVLGDKQADRTAGTIGVALALARQRVQLLRVHDVRAVRQALRLFAASGGLDRA